MRTKKGELPMSGAEVLVLLKAIELIIDKSKSKEEEKEALAELQKPLEPR